MKLKLSGARALLLGGSCELALALAEAMICAGIRPALTCRNPEGKTRIDEFLQSHGQAYECLEFDLAADGLNDALEKYLGQGVDYLVDFAQGNLEGLVASTDISAVRVFLDANIRGRAEVIQQTARSMLAQRRGRMVYISSAAAGQPNSGQGFYAAAKQAAEALYRSTGLELASRGVTTTILRPGYVGAGRGRRYMARNTTQVLDKVPLGRSLTIPEVVDAIMFLLCDSAAGFNAAVLAMDGGLSAGK